MLIISNKNLSRVEPTPNIVYYNFLFLFSSMKVIQNQHRIPSSKKPKDLVKMISRFEESVKKTNLKTKNQNLILLGNLKMLAKVQIELKKQSQENVIATALRIYLNEQILTVMNKHEKELICEYVNKIRELTTRRRRKRRAI